MSAAFPEIPLTPAFYIWMAAVPIMYFGLVILFRAMNLWEAKTRKGSRGSDIMAFLIVAGICVTYLGIVGVIAWFELEPSWDYDTLKKDNIYGRAQFVEDHLIMPMMSYQGWNLLLCLFNNDLRDPAMIGHHLVTGSLAYFGIHPYVHYYGLFFFGFAELTNIPLTLVDMFKYFPDLKEKMPVLNEFCRITFAVSFIIVRLIMWPYISYGFWVGALDLLRTGRAHSTFVVAVFFGANLFLTGLQFLWGSKIFGFLFKSGKKKSKKSA
mmetsp:Transcript_22435/g.32719  ORF Transcript_22435/g.32719 Transcript_22435/m.32719 type:complete len:267 (+) Transcript_22435:90-890(+)